MDALVLHLLFGSGNSPETLFGGATCSRACQVVTVELKALLDWITFTANNVDSGFGTLMTAFNSVTSGWQIKAIWGDNNQPLNGVTHKVSFLIAFSKADPIKIPGSKDILAAVHGDSCQQQECTQEQNLENITSWAKNIIKEEVIGQAGKYVHNNIRTEKGVIVIAFTAPGDASRVTALADKLRASGLQNSNIHVFCT